MKWALSQLFKYNKKPFSFSGTYDFSEYIENIDDILEMSIVTVEGVGQNIYDDRYTFDLHIKATMILECAVTLEPVAFDVDLDVTEIFDVIDDGEVNVIEKNTIDLKQVIWENVYLEKPMRITKFEANNK